MMRKSREELVTEVEIAQAHFPRCLPYQEAAKAEWREYFASVSWLAFPDLNPRERLAHFVANR